jgi:hypothetical protein
MFFGTVCVDDIIITGDGQFEITELKMFLQFSFQIKDLELCYFLGIEVACSKEGTNLS